jgi:hypothetical protein
MWTKMRNQADFSRENFRLKHVGHRYLCEQIATLTVRFKDEHLHLLSFGAARARALHSLFRKLVQPAMACFLARFKERHVRHGKE